MLGNNNYFKTEPLYKIGNKPTTTATKLSQASLSALAEGETSLLLGEGTEEHVSLLQLKILQIVHSVYQLEFVHSVKNSVDSLVIIV